MRASSYDWTARSRSPRRASASARLCRVKPSPRRSPDSAKIASAFSQASTAASRLPRWRSAAERVFQLPRAGGSVERRSWCFELALARAGSSWIVSVTGTRWTRSLLRSTARETSSGERCAPATRPRRARLPAESRRTSVPDPPVSTACVSSAGPSREDGDDGAHDHGRERHDPETDAAHARGDGRIASREAAPRSSAGACKGSSPWLHLYGGSATTPAAARRDRPARATRRRRGRAPQAAAGLSRRGGASRARRWRNEPSKRDCLRSGS